MCEAHKMLGLDFIKSRTLVQAQIIKLCTRNMQLETDASLLTRALEECNRVETGIENSEAKGTIASHWTLIQIAKVHKAHAE